MLCEQKPGTIVRFEKLGASTLVAVKVKAERKPSLEAQKILAVGNGKK